MHYTMLESFDPKTTLFKLSEGLKYLICTTGLPRAAELYETQRHEHCVVCVTEVMGVPRTVIHAAVKTDSGWGYGAGGCRILDGVSNAEQALQLQGYTAARP